MKPIVTLTPLLFTLLQPLRADVTYTTSLEPGGVISGKIQIGNTTTYAVFDTGVSHSIVSTKLVTDLRLSKLEGGQILTPGGKVSVPSYSCPPFSIGLIKPKAVERIVALDTKMLSSAAGLDIGAIVGMDIMRNYCLDIDYNSGKATIGQFVDFEMKVKNYSKQKLGVTSEGVPVIRIPKFKFPIRFDTGSDGGLGLGVKALDRAVSDQSATAFESFTMSVSIAGISRKRQAWLSSFALEDSQSVGVQIGEIELGDGDTADDAFIGADVIQNWNWVLDFSSETAYYTPSKHFGKPVLPDASGLGLLRTGETVFVGRAPSPDSPAESAALEVKDELVEINGIATSKLSLTAIRRILCDSTGVKVNLVIMRGETRKVIDLVLKSPLDSK